jgi:hypothetical protein
MATSFFALVCLTLLGFGVCRRINRSRSWVLNPAVEIGTGFFVSAAFTALFLSSAIFSVSQASHIFFAVSALIVASLMFDSDYRQTLLRLFSVAPANSMRMLLTLVIATYLLLIFLNNSVREIFPWDAFTTWMYRAKAWVMADQATAFLPIDQWLTNDAAGFAIAAAHYPISVSAIAAFAASVSGGWSDHAASLPWFFASVASVLSMLGLCRLQHPKSSLIPLLGATALITMPLVHLHGVLAGYADIWVMGTSGMGLASICLWTQQRSSGLLYLSVLLLSLGCFWKIEGWLWMGLGIGLLTLVWLWERFRVNAAMGIAPALVILALVQPMHLGALGLWGIDAEGLKLGVLGTVGFRSYNPLPDYLDMVFQRGNFLLIGPLYLLALGSILLLSPRKHFGYVLMGSMILAAHGVIFGLSDYSEYAQIGTAINRLLLQTLPVLIITIAALPQVDWFADRGVDGKSQSATSKRSIVAVVATILVTTLALPLTLAPLGPSASSRENGAQNAVYAASDLNAVVGQLVEGAHGYQFRGRDLPIGVARAEVRSPGSVQPRYLLTDTWMTTPENISFYWINADAPQVHSVPIEASGHSVLDMAHYPEFWNKPIQELGFLVQPQSFESTALRSITLSNSLLSAAPALVNHWISSAALSQRLINTTTGHIKTPITLQRWLSVAFLLLLLLAMGWAIRSPSQRANALNLAWIGAGVLWLVGSAGHINQVLNLTLPLGNPIVPSVTEPTADGAHLQALSESIRSDETIASQPVFTLGLDEQGRFDAQRLPLMLLPVRAAPVTEGQLALIDSKLNHSVVLFSRDSALLSSAVERLIDNTNLHLDHEGIGYATLVAANL